MTVGNTASQMRTYGRVLIGGQLIWMQVNPDANGDPSQIYFTTFLQCLKLVLGEDPFWGNYGIPIFQSIQTQQPPDYYVMQMQQRFAPFFASLVVSRVESATEPTYDISVMFKTGATYSVTLGPQLLVDANGAAILNGNGSPIVVGSTPGVFFPS